MKEHPIEKALNGLSEEEMQRFTEQYPSIAQAFLSMMAQACSDKQWYDCVHSGLDEHDWKIDALKVATDKLIQHVDPEGYSRTAKQINAERPLHVMPFYGAKTPLDVN